MSSPQFEEDEGEEEGEMEELLMSVAEKEGIYRRAGFE